MNFVVYSAYKKKSKREKESAEGSSKNIPFTKSKTSAVQGKLISNSLVRQNFADSSKPDDQTKLFVSDWLKPVRNKKTLNCRLQINQTKQKN